MGDEGNKKEIKKLLCRGAPKRGEEQRKNFEQRGKKSGGKCYFKRKNEARADEAKWSWTPQRYECSCIYATSMGHSLGTVTNQATRGETSLPIERANGGELLEPP